MQVGFSKENSGDFLKGCGQFFKCLNLSDFAQYFFKF